MRRFPARNCRECQFAEWTMAAGEVARVNPFQPGACGHEGETAATIGEGLKLPLDPQAPLGPCRAFVAVDAEAEAA